MPDYRAFLVGDDGHIRNAVVLHCGDDDTAIEQAKQLVDGHDVELWQRERMIVKLFRKDMK